MQRVYAVRRGARAIHAGAVRGQAAEGGQPNQLPYRPSPFRDHEPRPGPGTRVVEVAAPMMTARRPAVPSISQAFDALGQGPADGLRELDRRAAVRAVRAVVEHYSQDRWIPLCHARGRVDG